MIFIENVETYGWEAAIRGMRNPMNSWDRSDSEPMFNVGDGITPCIGENDLILMQGLAAAGTDHSKYLRMITVTLDINAPLYWWKEFDTYKVGTVANSCSTMHKIHSKEFTLDDFSTEHLNAGSLMWIKGLIYELNRNRECFIESKDKQYWWQMIQMLPTSYNQKRTVQLNYAVLKNIYFSRKGHKLDEWHTFCNWVENLPYFKEIVLGE